MRYFNELRRSAWMRVGVLSVGWMLFEPAQADARTEVFDPAEVESGSLDLDPGRSEFPRPNFLGSFQKNAVETFEPSDILKNITVNYFGMISSPSLQAVAPGYRESLLLRNFLGVGYRLSELVTLSGNAYWSVRGLEQFPTQIHDPFVRLADGSFLSGENWNLYVDARLHLPLSSASVNSGLNLGIQSVQALTYSIPESRFALGLSSSIRANVLSVQGYGSDLDLYLGPNLFYQLAPSLGLNCLFESQMSHVRSRSSSGWSALIFDLEPGLAWDVMPNLSVNPYIHLPMGGLTSFSPTYAGLLLSWTLL